MVNRGRQWTRLCRIGLADRRCLHRRGHSKYSRRRCGSGNLGRAPPPFSQEGVSRRGVRECSRNARELPVSTDAGTLGGRPLSQQSLSGALRTDGTLWTGPSLPLCVWHVIRGRRVPRLRSAVECASIVFRKRADSGHRPLWSSALRRTAMRLVSSSASTWGRSPSSSTGVIVDSLSP